MIYIDLTPPPAIVCQLTDEQQAAAYRDRIKQQGDNYAREQAQAARQQAQQAAEQGRLNAGATDSQGSAPAPGPQGTPKPKPRPSVTNIFNR